MRFHRTPKVVALQWLSRDRLVGQSQLSQREFLTEQMIGVRLVGVDYLSVGGLEGEGGQTHRSLLEEGVWIIEGLDLSQVAPGRYYLVCLPLRILAGDGAPARAILRPLRASETAQR